MHEVLTPDNKIQSIKACSPAQIVINTDLTFKIQRSNSFSPSKVVYWDPETKLLKKITFNDGEKSGYVLLMYDGLNLKCTGGGCGHVLSYGGGVKAIIVSLTFQPSKEKMNMYSLSGSYYNVICSLSMFVSCSWLFFIHRQKVLFFLQGSP